MTESAPLASSGSSKNSQSIPPVSLVASASAATEKKAPVPAGSERKEGGGAVPGADGAVFSIRVCKLDSSIVTLQVRASTTVDELWGMLAVSPQQRRSNNLLLTKTMAKLVGSTATLAEFGVGAGARLDVVPRPRT